jgi:hypothetical protein
LHGETLSKKWTVTSLATPLCGKRDHTALNSVPSGRLSRAAIVGLGLDLGFSAISSPSSKAATACHSMMPRSSELLGSVFSDDELFLGD